MGKSMTGHILLTEGTTFFLREYAHRYNTVQAIVKRRGDSTEPTFTMINHEELLVLLIAAYKLHSSAGNFHLVTKPLLRQIKSIYIDMYGEDGLKALPSANIFEEESSDEYF